MADVDKLNIDSIIQRLLEGKLLNIYTKNHILQAVVTIQEMRS